MDLYISGEIDSKTVLNIADTLENLKDGENITIYFNSNGGFVRSAEQITEMLISAKENGSFITCVNTGNVSSSATIIYLVGDKRIFDVSQGEFLIHRPYYDNTSGDGDTMLEQTIYLIDLENTLVDLYSMFSDKSKESILERMKENEPLTEKELVEFGLVTEIKVS